MSTELLTLDPKQLEMLADEAISSESSSAGPKMISTRNGRMSVDGMPIVGDSVVAIILASPIEHNYYKGVWDPDSIAPPVCSAIGTNPMELKPTERSSEPQSDACHACKQNQWGSSLTGSRKGKACKETRKLVFIEGELVTDADSVNKAQLYGIRPPVNSIGVFSTFVKKVAVTLRKPLFCARVKISLVPDPKKQFVMNFQLIEEITDTALILALMDRSKRETAILLGDFGSADEVGQIVEQDVAF
jgi:hypothetical protein